MAEIRIHGHQSRITMLVGPTDARHVGRADALLPGSMQDFETRVFGGQAVENGAGAIGRIVVDEKEVEVEACGADVGDDELDVLCFVVCGDHHEGSDLVAHQASTAAYSASTMRAANSSKVVRADHPVARAIFAGFPTRDPRLTF